MQLLRLVDGFPELVDCWNIRRAQSSWRGAAPDGRLVQRTVYVALVDDECVFGSTYFHLRVRPKLGWAALWHARIMALLRADADGVVRRLDGHRAIVLRHAANRGLYGRSPCAR